MQKIRQPGHRFAAWVGLLMILSVPAFVGAAQKITSVGRPNIILILADDLGYGDLGCYGQTRIKTPNLDRLASQGMRFTSAYAGSTVCAPSRCALMTGLHSGHGLIRGNSQQSLGRGERTVAEVLREAGYHTGLIGKWGLGEAGSTGVPAKKGFNEFVGYLNQTHAHDYYTDHLFRFDIKSRFDGKVKFLENEEGRKGLYTHDVFTSAALKFLDLNKPDEVNGYRPFFLFLSYTIPHANNEEGRLSGNGMQVPSDAPYSGESWPQVEKNKAAMISRLDGDVGKLMQKLKALELDQNTLVLFSSDNGPHKEGGVNPQFFQSSGPLRGIKRDLYEGGIRVPMIAWWPARIKPGQVTDLACAFWDFLPTAAEVGQAQCPKNLDGISFLPTLLGQPQIHQHPWLYWEFHEQGFRQALRMGEWKGIRRLGEPTELYNLKADLGEKENVAAKHPDVVAKIDEALDKARTESDRWPIKKAAAKAQ